MGRGEVGVSKNGIIYIYIFIKLVGFSVVNFCYFYGDVFFNEKNKVAYGVKGYLLI